MIPKTRLIIVVTTAVAVAVGMLVMLTGTVMAVGSCPEAMIDSFGSNYTESQAPPQNLPDPDVARATYALQADGIEYVLVICVDFQDAVAVRTMPQVNASIFGLGNVSVRDYFDEVSYNQLDFSPGPAPSPVGWYRMAHNMTYYGADDGTQVWPDGLDLNRTQLITDALNAADPGLNFTQYDRDNDQIVDHVMILHAGGDQALGFGYPDDHIWSVSTHGNFGTYDGVSVTSVTIVAENPNEPGLPIGTICHEFFHDLGAPDLYDYDQAPVPSEVPVGRWCLMESGSWLGPPGYPAGAPSHICGFLKHDIDGDPSNGIDGWLEETVITASSTVSVDQLASATGSRLFRIDISETDEYFLIENREQTGRYDSWLPEAGILIWHIDGDIPGGSRFNDGPPAYPHYAVWVEDPSPAIPDKDGAAYSTDDGQTLFDGATNPDSDAYNGNPSGVSIEVLSSEGATMDVRITFGVPVAYLYSSWGIRTMADEISDLTSTEPGKYDFTSYNDANIGDLWSKLNDYRILLIDEDTFYTDGSWSEFGGPIYDSFKSHASALKSWVENGGAIFTSGESDLYLMGQGEDPQGVWWDFLPEGMQVKSYDPEIICPVYVFYDPGLYSYPNSLGNSYLSSGHPHSWFTAWDSGYAPTLRRTDNDLAIELYGVFGKGCIVVTEAEVEAGSGWEYLQNQLEFVVPSTSYTMNILSPQPGQTLYVGQQVTIKVAITDNSGNPVSGVTVTATSPSGAPIPLTETLAVTATAGSSEGSAGLLASPGTGIYEGTYEILPTDPIGDWIIAIVASVGGEFPKESVPVEVTAWSYIFEDPVRGTKLFINTDNKTLQFTAPDGYDSGVVSAQSMRVYTGSITILHLDESIFLTFRANTSTGFCYAYLIDKMTRAIYRLNDPAG